MKRLCVVFCLFAFVLGCAADGPKEQWANLPEDMKINPKSDLTQTKAVVNSTAPVQSAH
jgi:hypothetical protein